MKLLNIEGEKGKSAVVLAFVEFLNMRSKAQTIKKKKINQILCKFKTFVL